MNGNGTALPRQCSCIAVEGLPCPTFRTSRPNWSSGGSCYGQQQTALAVHLFKSGDIASAQAAKLARMSLPQFLAHLSAQGIPVVDHEPAELEQELAAFDAAR